MKYFLFILFLTTQNLLFSQSMILTNVSVDNYPQVDCEYLMLDNNNKKFVPLPEDLHLIENGLDQNLVNFECDNNKQPEPISVVITIDNSASMLETDGNPKNRTTIVREAAKKFIDILDPQSEIAITYFSTSSEIVQPLTYDKVKAKAAIDNIPDPIGGTGMANAFIQNNSGSIDALKGANSRKVIVFLTDGNDANFSSNEVIEKISSDNVKIYCLAVSTNMDSDLKLVANKTDGLWFDNIYGTQTVEKVYKALALLTQGIEPCKISYKSENCDLKRDLELLYKDISKDDWRLDLDKSLLVEYAISPKEIRLFDNGTAESSEFINLVSRTDSLIINNISTRYNEFSIEELTPLSFPIRLDKGEKIIFKLKTNNSNVSKNDVVLIKSNSCQDNNIPVYYVSIKKNLNVLTPNGGEVYYVGSQLGMEWEDKSEEDEYKLEISTDAGINWDLVTENYNARDFTLDKTPNTPTDEALFKVSNTSSDLINIRTNNLASLTNAEGEFEKLVRIEKNKYLAISTFRYYFEYRNLIVDSTNQSSDDAGFVKKILMILDSNLIPIRHKVIKADMENYKITVTDDNIFILIGLKMYLFYDDKIELSYSSPVIGTGVLLKIDNDLEYVSHKIIQSNSSDAFSETQLIDFVSYEDKLFVMGEFGIDMAYDSEVLVDTTYYTSGIYLLSVNTNLVLEKYKFWSKGNDGLSASFNKIKALDLDKLSMFGSATKASLLKLAGGIYSIFNFEYNLSTDTFEERTKLQAPKASNYNIIDFESYKDISYYLMRVSDTLYYNDKVSSIYNKDSRVRVIAINNNQELEWEAEFDQFSLDKNMIINDNQELIVLGRTNEAFQFDTISVPRSANAHFVSAIDLYSGEKKWLKFVTSSKYGNQYIADGNQIISNGEIYNRVDFGNGYVDSVDNQSGEFEKPYLWSIGIDRESKSDVSDSLWSISKSPFKYIDTIDFGKVYWGTTKDTNVLSFIEREKLGKIEIQSITIDNLKFGTDFVGTEILEDKLDVSFTFNPDQLGEDLGRGIISTNQGNYYFYLIGEGVDLRWSYKDSIVIDFGPIDINEFSTRDTLIARNKGESEITIDSVLVIGDENNEFSYNITSEKDRVFSFDSLLSEFRYEPKFDGLSEAEVHFYLAVQSKPIVVLLRGVGITRDSVRLKIIADSSSSEPNLLNEIVLSLEIDEDPQSLDMDKIDVHVSYNATLLLPFRFDDSGIVIDKTRHITLTFSRSYIDLLKLESKFLPTIGNSISTEIKIDSVSIYNSKNEIINQTVIETENGFFSLEGVCFSDGKYRLYDEANPLDLIVFKENGEYFVNYNLTESGKTKILLFDINGTYISDIVSNELQRGEHKTEIITDNISNGNYVLQLETPTEIVIKIFTIVR